MSETQTSSSTEGTQRPAEGGSYERDGGNLQRVERTEPAPDRAATEPQDPDVQRAEAAQATPAETKE